MGGLRVIDALQDRPELVAGRVLLAFDLEFDQRRMPVLRDLSCTAGTERRLDVLNGLQLRDPGHDVRNSGVEGGGADSQRAALDEHALVRGQLEAIGQDPVHAPGLAGPGSVRIDVLDAYGVADLERNDDECEPAERGGLPVSRAPAAHAGSQVAVSAAVGAGHVSSPFGGSCRHGMSTSLTLVAVVRSAT